MHFPSRLYGIENEFAVVGQTSHGTFIDALGISPAIELKPQQHSVLAQESTEGSGRLWHTNGSCTYIDIGNHPEHATAECLSARDATKYNKAGEIIASRVFDYPSTDNIRLLLFKNNLGYDIHGDDPTTSGQFGCHENYLVHIDSFQSSIIPPTAHEYDQKIQIFKPLIPFLATRQIFDGSGWWERDMTFHLSQRAFSIQKETGTGASFDRSFFQIKTGDTGADTRVHIVSGDANICEFALYLKLGTTSLVLALIESGCCPLFWYKNSVAALKEISRYQDTCMNPFQVGNSAPLRALDVQSIFFEAVRAQLTSATYASDEIEAEVAHIMLSWEHALNAFYNGDDEWKRGRIDHATKRYIAEMHTQKQKIHDTSELSLVYKTIDIMYHCVSNPALQQQIKNKWHDRRIIDDDEINYATIHPPQNTRARMRGMFVQTLIDKYKSITDGINWNRLDVNHGKKHYYLNLPYGLISHSDEFEKFLLLVEQ